MAKTVKCPNKECPHVFDVQELAGKASMKCPECGKGFALRRPAAPPPRPAAAPPEEEEPREYAGAYRRPSGGSSYLWIVVGAVLLVGGAGAGIYYAVQKPPGLTKQRGDTFTSDDLYYTFKYPDAPWQEAKELEIRIGANSAMRYKWVDPQTGKPLAWFGLRVRDYRTRVPSRADLIDKELTEVAAKKFTDFKPDPIDAEVKLGGLDPVGAFKFTAAYRLNPDELAAGEADADNPAPVEVPVVGQVLVARSESGLGYWAFAFARKAAIEKLGPELIALRDRLRVTEREGWSPAPPKLLDFRPYLPPLAIGDPARRAEYMLQTPLGWRSGTPLKELMQWEPKLRLQLYRRNRRETGKGEKLTSQSEIWVAELPAAEKGKEVEAVRAFLKDHITRDLALTPEMAKEVKVTVDPVSPEQAPLVDGLEPPPEPFGRFRSEISDDADADTYWAARVVIVEDEAKQVPKLVVAVGTCPWKNREIWEADFLTALKTLRPVKK